MTNDPLPPNAVVTVLNDRWRVVNDPIQWILQYRQGNPEKNQRAWRGRFFHQYRGVLKRSIAENCGDVDPEAMVIIECRSDDHRAWEAPL